MIAERTRLGRTTVQRSPKKLEAKGYVTRESGDGERYKSVDELFMY